MIVHCPVFWFMRGPDELFEINFTKRQQKPLRPAARSMVELTIIGRGFKTAVASQGLPKVNGKGPQFASGKDCSDDLYRDVTAIPPQPDPRKRTWGARTYIPSPLHDGTLSGSMVISQDDPRFSDSATPVKRSANPLEGHAIHSSNAEAPASKRPRKLLSVDTATDNVVVSPTRSQQAYNGINRAEAVKGPSVRIEREQEGTIRPGGSTHNTFWTLVNGVPQKCFKEDANPRLLPLLDLLSPEETFQHSQRFDSMGDSAYATPKQESRRSKRPLEDDAKQSSDRGARDLLAGKHEQSVTPSRSVTRSGPAANTVAEPSPQSGSDCKGLARMACIGAGSMANGLGRDEKKERGTV
ncbi:MAG: hypothetical protein Q9226_003076 [Calogaya cf. arnoldii]